MNGSARPAPDHSAIDRPEWLSERGREIYGPTPPGKSVPVARQSALDDGEVGEVVSLIAEGRTARHTVVLPERLQTRHWPSVTRVSLALVDRLGWEGFGWKIGAASAEIRRSEGVPSPSAGRLHRRGRASSPAALPAELFVNYRCCECEFAFELGVDFPARDEPWTEEDARAGIESVMPALEIGDTVFDDWYGASGFFGSCLDNGGAAAFVEGPKHHNWREFDLSKSSMDVYLNDHYVKSGVGAAAMGHPVTSLTWLLNWLRERSMGTTAGEVVSTGTCTGHLFALPGDTVRVEFAELGSVEAKFL
ncbi:MAG: fumarylacetoacetate hydrolase family protein [Acidimicrobiales bacterium]